MEALVSISTFLLALFTAALAFSAFKQMQQTNTNEQRRFEFEMYRLAQAKTPIVVAEYKIENRNAVGLEMRNVGTGPAVNVRFSGLFTWSVGQSPRQQEYSGAQRSVSAIGAGEKVVAVHKEFFEAAHELLIRYEDIFGNIYSTEYIRFERDASWYVWRKPHLGKDLSLERPSECSEDYPTWGFRSRQYYDASKGLW